MKIFPLIPMSNYERFMNMVNILAETKPAKMYNASTEKAVVDLQTNVKHNTQKQTWEKIIAKCKLAINKIITKIKDNHVKKSSIN